MQIFKTLLLHEWRLLFREPRFWIPFLLPPLFVMVPQWFWSQHSQVTFPTEVSAFILLLLGAFGAPCAAPLTADAFAGERERRSLELLQLTPVCPSKIFAAKLCSILPFPILFAWGTQTVFFFLHPEIPVEILLKSYLAAVSVTLFLNGSALVISMCARSVRSATQNAVFLSFPIFILIQMFAQTYFSNTFLPFGLFVASVIWIFAFSVSAFKKFRRL